MFLGCLLSQTYNDCYITLMMIFSSYGICGRNPQNIWWVMYIETTRQSYRPTTNVYNDCGTFLSKVKTYMSRVSSRSQFVQSVIQEFRKMMMGFEDVIQDGSSMFCFLGTGPTKAVSQNWESIVLQSQGQGICWWSNTHFIGLDCPPMTSYCLWTQPALSWITISSSETRTTVSFLCE